MHATTESAEITAQLPSKPRSDIALTALYSAALGPVHLSRYLPIFARFDEAGRTTTSWNWAASLCTLNWMVFRQLWGAALVYGAAAESLALLVWGVGRPRLHWPAGVEWGVLGAFAVLRKQSLLGDAMSHAALPGVVLTFMLTGLKTPAALMIGAAVMRWTSGTATLGGCGAPAGIVGT